MLKSFSVLLALTLMLGLNPARAQDSVWTIDASHSNVLFTITHMVISEVTGSFSEFEGTLAHTKPDFSDAKLSAVIQTKSITTNNERRDNHLRSADFFLADSFPTITFESSAFEKTGANTFDIKGNLTMRGVTKPVTLKARYNGEIKDARGNFRAGFKASTTINRMDFGVMWSRQLDGGGVVVSDNVDIVLNMELNKKGKPQGN